MLDTAAPLHLSTPEKTTVSILFESKFTVLVAWDTEFVQY